MALKLRNRWTFVGDEGKDDRWKWEAFLDDCGTGELADVDFVEYVLHPTFRNPIREVDDPEGGFLLRTNGWGEFALNAFVHMKDGTTRKLTHQLELKRQPATGVSA